MSSPTRFYPVSERPYAHKPHVPSVATTEAKRQPNAKRRAVSIRALRNLKSVNRNATST